MTPTPETSDSLLIRVRDRKDRAAWDQFDAIYRPVIYRPDSRHHLSEHHVGFANGTTSHNTLHERFHRSRWIRAATRIALPIFNRPTVGERRFLTKVLTSVSAGKRRPRRFRFFMQPFGFELHYLMIADRVGQNVLLGSKAWIFHSKPGLRIAFEQGIQPPPSGWSPLFTVRSIDF
ncbi:MAG: hypothetical protein WBD31_17935 [Rubripirellula sp.]